MPRWPPSIFGPPHFTATGTTPLGHDSPQTDAVVRAQALSSFSETITYAGPTGDGHRMKLLHNYVSLGFVAPLAEAAACARRAGLDPEVFVDVLAKGGGAGAALNRLAPYLVARDASGLRFAMSNAEKDLSYYVAMVREGASAGVFAAAVLKTFEAASRTSPDAFVPSLVDLLSADQSQSQPA